MSIQVYKTINTNSCLI